MDNLVIMNNLVVPMPMKWKTLVKATSIHLNCDDILNLLDSNILDILKFYILIF
jgi:hypothetical protein